MNRPIFSCVIPVKGERPFMKQALASLEAQGMGDDLEIIIQDADIEPDSGQSDALNKGFAKAHGEWLFWLNADDVLLPNALRKVKALIDNSNTQQLNNSKASPSWIAGNMVRIDAEGKVVSCVRGNGWHDGLYRHAVPHVSGPSAFFRRELFERVGGFDASLHYCMDWDLWIRFMRAGAKFRRLGAYCWGFRQWDGSKTQKTTIGSDYPQQQEEVGRMLRKNGFVPTRAGAMKLHLWRLLSGLYLRTFFDTMRLRGRKL